MSSLNKTEVPGIYKERDGILINKDNEALHAYKKRKIQSRKMQNFEEDLETLKSDMAEIKALLKGLVK
jgi:hypothetical protein